MHRIRTRIYDREGVLWEDAPEELPNLFKGRASVAFLLLPSPATDRNGV